MTESILLIDCLKIVCKVYLTIAWLEDRKKLPKDWYNFEKAAEEKIKELTKNIQQYAEEKEIYDYLK